MEIGDVAFGVHFGERQRHFFQQLSGKDCPKTDDEMRLWDIAWEQAHEEMMDENHTMLAAICEKLGITK